MYLYSSDNYYTIERAKTPLSTVLLSLSLSAWVIAINDLCNFFMISTMGLFAFKYIRFVGLYY